MRKQTHDEIGNKRKTLEEVQNIKRFPIHIVCDNIRSIYNIGSIFRTSDAALIEKLYLTGFTPYPPRPEIEKVALGSTKSVPWEYHKNPVELIMKLKTENISIGCLEITDESKSYYDLDELKFPVCLILGNELTGVSNELISMSDFSLEIPQYGFKHSINVSVAYGIAIFEIIKFLNQ
jgi:tRNA G18 (ribose-2'-O)-methylase SpoU